MSKLTPKEIADITEIGGHEARNLCLVNDAAYERGREDALSEEGVKQSVDSIIKREHHRILAYLDEATDTRDLDRRLRELKDE